MSRRGYWPAMDDLDSAVAEMAGMLRFYESVLKEHDIGTPYFTGQ